MEKIHKGRDITELGKNLTCSEFDKAKLVCMLGGYSSYYLEEDIKRMRPLAIEQWFDVPLRNAEGIVTHRRLIGKMDGIVEYEGKIVVFEHKSTKALIETGSSYIEGLRLQPQAGLYYLAAQEMGFKIEGILYNVARVPQQRWKKGETPFDYAQRVTEAIAEKPESYFARELFRYTEQEQEESLRDIWETWELMDAGFNPRYTNNCFWGNSRCEYYPICSGEGLEGFKRNDYVPLQRNVIQPIRGSLGSLSISLPDEQPEPPVVFG